MPPEGFSGALITYFILPSGAYLHFVDDDFLVCEQLCTAETLDTVGLEFMQTIYCFCTQVTLEAATPDELLVILQSLPDSFSRKTELIEEVTGLVGKCSMNVDDILKACQEYTAKIADIEKTLSCEESQDIRDIVRD